MNWKWLENRRQAKHRLQKQKDHMRPYYVAKRLKLRLDEAAENLDVERANVLLKRMRRVHDFQLRQMKK